MKVIRQSSVVLALTLLACGDDGGSGVEFDAGLDAPTVAPIVAPTEQWTWVQIPGMTCGNGSTTGVAVNLSERSRDVVVLLNGGGACWDATTCFVLRSAASIDTDFGAPQFQQIMGAVAASPFFQRGATAPFPDASYVFVPYCTGDVHTGHKVTTYATNGGPREVHHVGQDNLDALWPRLRATRLDASTLWVTGISAGGYGAMVEGPRARAAWPGVTVHMVSDSSHPVNPEAARWAAMKASWNLDIPAGCPACANGLAGYPAYLRTISPAGSRWGLMMTTQDQVISTFMGFTGPALETQTLAIRDLLNGNGQAAFVINGTSHVLTASAPPPSTTTGASLTTWLRELSTGTLRTVGP
jgi:Pectinacetylesterase